MPLSPALVEVLRCPVSREPLVYFPAGESGSDEASAFLLCPASRRRYRVEHGYPVLLADEAIEVAAADADRLVARARELGLRVP